MNMEEYLNWLHEMAKDNQRHQLIVYNDAHHKVTDEPSPAKLPLDTES